MLKKSLCGSKLFSSSGPDISPPTLFTMPRIILLSDSVPAFNKDSMRCVAAATRPHKCWLTRSDSSVYLSLALTADRWIPLTHRKKAPRMIRQHYSLFIGATLDWVLLGIINPCRSIAEPVCSQCPDFFPLKHVQTYTLKLCFVVLPCFVLGKNEAGGTISLLCSCLLKEREQSVCNLAIAYKGFSPLKFLCSPLPNWFVIILLDCFDPLLSIRSSFKSIAGWLVRRQ